MCIYHLQTIKHKYKVGLKFHILVKGITSFSNLYFYIVDLARCKWFVIMQGELVLQCSNSVYVRILLRKGQKYRTNSLLGWRVILYKKNNMSTRGTGVRMLSKTTNHNTVSNKYSFLIGQPMYTVSWLDSQCIQCPDWTFNICNFLIGQLWSLSRDITIRPEYNLHLSNLEKRLISYLLCRDSKNQQ
jgi:hypothetical protein